MKFPIGFHLDDPQPGATFAPSEVCKETAARESVALVSFPTCRIPLSYYNDRFDLNSGDIVFVEGKYEGVAGRVEKVSTDFKIKVEDYKKVLSVAGTEGWARRITSLQISRKNAGAFGLKCLWIKVVVPALFHEGRFFGACFFVF